MTKAEQTHKSKTHSQKRMSKPDYRKYRNWLTDCTDGTCQICGYQADDMHHTSYGCYGADKDDRSIIAVCRDCHDVLHADRDRNEAAKEIGRGNWAVYSETI